MLVLAVVARWRSPTVSQPWGDMAKSVPRNQPATRTAELPVVARPLRVSPMGDTDSEPATEETAASASSPVDHDVVIVDLNA